jgi:hypothetical protein
MPVVSFSCFGGNIKAELGEDFTLPVGKTADIAGEDLSIQFVEVTADSRCPQYAKCIVAGEAKCLMYIHYGQSVSSIEFTKQGGSGEDKEVFNKYLITFTLEPLREIGQDIAPSDYKLVMTITIK